MSISNFDSANLAGSGELISQGTSPTQVVRDIADMLLTNASTVFGEVTSGGPTGLEGWATDLSGGIYEDLNDDDPATSSITLYFKDDTLLGSGDARLLRLTAAQYGVVASIIDTASAVDANDWVVLYSEYDKYGDEHDYERALFYDSLGGGINVSNEEIYGLLSWPNTSGNPGQDYTNSNLQSDIKVYFWCDTNWVHIRTKSEVSGSTLGRIHVFTTTEPSDGSWTRTNYPTVAAIHTNDEVPGGQDLNLHKRVIRPTSTGSQTPYHRVRGWFQGEIGSIPNYRDEQNNEYFQRAAAYFYSDDSQVWGWMGYIPGLRIIRDSADVSYLGETVVDAVTYICIDKNDGIAYLIPAKTS